MGAAELAGVDGRAARVREARRLLERVAPERVGWSERAGEGRVWPVAEPLRPLLPAGGLRRGSVVSVRSSGALLLAMVSEASAQGAWCAMVGLPDLGMVAAAEAGLELSRVALVPRPGGELVPVASALLDGLDLVVVAGVERLRQGDRQRLAAKARQRGAVLMPTGRWPGADVTVSVVGGCWRGMSGGGSGRLLRRSARVRAEGRGVTRTAGMLLPGSAGRVAPEPVEGVDAQRPRPSSARPLDTFPAAGVVAGVGRDAG